MPNNIVSIDECRNILGSAAEGKTDEQIEHLRDELALIAADMYDHLARKTAVTQTDVDAAAVDLPGIPADTPEDLQRDRLDSVRWTTYAFENDGVEGEQ